MTSCTNGLGTGTKTQVVETPEDSGRDKEVAPPLDIALLWFWKDASSAVKEKHHLFGGGSDVRFSRSTSSFFHFGILLSIHFSSTATQTSPGISLTLIYIEFSWNKTQNKGRQSLLCVATLRQTFCPFKDCKRTKWCFINDVATMEEQSVVVSPRTNKGFIKELLHRLLWQRAPC